MFEIVKIICLSLSAYVLMASITKNYSRPLAFVAFALWFRFALSAFHEITHHSLVAGLSINALGSIFVVIIGAFVLPSRAFLFKQLVPLYAFLLVIVVSGLYNTNLVELSNVVVKWTYFLVLTMALVIAVRMHNINGALKTLLSAFFLPISLFVFSVLLGEVKASESDGSMSYIGGFSHEASFSMIILSFALMTAFIDKLYLPHRTAYFFLAVLILYLINYRTAILAIVPVVLFFVFAGTYRKTPSKYRLFSFSLLSIFLLGALYFASVGMSARFADLSVLVSNWDELLKAPEYFSRSERQILSNRLYLWSQYISEYSQADTLRQVIGFGPESWKQSFTLYAHNTYVSYLYEYGALGLFSFMFFLLSIFFQAMRLSNMELKLKLLGSLVGFLIMNMATMPLWNVEGIITFSIIIASILSARNHQHNRRVNEMPFYGQKASANASMPNQV